MPTNRQRNYKAEYDARQARSKAKYGVSYNKQRALIKEAKDLHTGITPDQVRESLVALVQRGIPNPAVVVERRLQTARGRRGEYRSGRRPPLPPQYHDFEGEEATAPVAGRVSGLPSLGDIVSAGDSVGIVRGGRPVQTHVLSVAGDAIITSVNVSEGEPVTRGQIIVTFGLLEDLEYDDDIFSGPEWEYYRA